MNKLIFASLLVFVAFASGNPEKYVSLPYLSGQVSSAEGLNELFDGWPNVYGRNISTVTVGVYRKSVGWRCCIVTVPDFSDPRLSGTEQYSCSYSNFTHTAYAFSSIKLECSDIWMIEYSILFSEKSQVINECPNIGTVNNDIVPLIVVGVLFTVFATYFAVYITVKLYKIAKSSINKKEVEKITDEKL